jgi:biofilm PGA synthesis N-glycosyltransferase PgaC
MPADLAQLLRLATYFCFGYPFVMAWFWMAGGVFFYLWREFRSNPPDRPPELEHWPPISILVPCFNEALNAIETLTHAHAVDYPDFEIIAINDGSSDDTGAILDQLALEFPRLRVIHLATNGGKARALNVAARLARHELLLCIDGDALLDPHALRWAAFRFRRPDVGAITGNPRIRNRSSIIGRMQVGEFSSIIGLIKRAQASYGWLFTVSGVICGFRRKALQDAGWWSQATLTEDIDVSWRVQLAGWRIDYAPNVIVWILMPETLRGLWKQRLRWAEGGSQMMLDHFGDIFRLRAPGLLPTYFSNVLSVVWAYLVVLTLLVEVMLSLGLAGTSFELNFKLFPAWWGLFLALTYLLQALISFLIERRYETGMLRSLFWIIWYPLAFWLISLVTTVAAFPRVLAGRGRRKGTWVSPDRGFR